MATVALPMFIEQEIARYGQGRSMHDILAEALVNHRWDDEKYEPHEQLRNPDEALADMMRTSGRSREQIVHDALIEWVSDHQADEEALKTLQELREGKTTTVTLEEIMDRYGLER
ncbi:hypothetical protein [Terriglobus sp.]|uniref:hypothetical protein n=1 Tax=Terriglobus sp. TaxID=1889013 RepID=UPI003AFF8496